MNYRVIVSILGRVFLILALLMCLPVIVAFIYNENTFSAFLIPIVGLIALGVGLSLIKVKDKSLYAKEGFVIVALVWIIISVIGCLPFLISGVIKDFPSAFFETVSGFTTTGSSVMQLSDTEIVTPKSIMFWRIFTHWIGGMGVLVFLLALLPSNANTMYIYKAESPGPSSSKLVSKVKHTALILYGIYILLSAIMTAMLLFGGLDLYESLLTMFATAGTGGFAPYGNSIAHYNSVYVEVVVSVFMMLFGLNFNVYYMILIGKFAKAFKSEEFITYLIIMFTATLTIALNILSITGSFGQSLRYSYFQASSIMSTTGFTSVNFDSWPTLSKSILLLLSVIGACGGSTGGGIKVSRLIILTKSSVKDIRRNMRSRSVNCLMYEGQPLEREVERNVRTYFVLWVALVIISTILLSFDSFADVYTHFASTITCIGNVGPAISDSLGALGTFDAYSGFSKMVLSVMMLAGRLEIFPLIILLTPRTWIRGK